MESKPSIQAPLRANLRCDAHDIRFGSQDRVLCSNVGAAHNPRTNGPVWAQHDGPPVDGTYPTSTWEVGQLLRDRHTLVLDASTPPGLYELEVGLYAPDTGTRLRRLDAKDDRAVLLHVRVE